MPENEIFTLEIDGLSSEIHLLSFHGSEGLSQLYDYHVEIASPDADIDLDAVIGKPALVTIEADDEPRYVHGIVSRFEMTGSGPEYTHYGASIVPAFWTLGLRQDSCIFQAKSTPQILKQVLEEDGLAEGSDFRISAQGSYPPREYCVQYRETDFAFLSRLMEEDGLFYFFEHTDAGHKLVIADAVGAYAAIPGDTTIPFRHGGTGLTSEHAEVRNLRFSRSMQSGKVELRAFNFQKTELDLKQQAEGDAETDLEHYDYAGRYEEGDVGAARTQVRLQALRTRYKVLSGESNCRHLAPGYKFSVAEHPRDSLNAEYVVMRVSHSGSHTGSSRGESYRNSFDAIPSDTLYRAPQITPRGLVDGPQTAMVTGPSGEEIYCDAHGRVKVQFHWDRIGAKDDKSSCWVRVSQAWAGGAYGAMAIPRIGHEVLVDFLQGDPDQPIIVGRVYNGTSPHGYDLPADKTKTSIRSNSSPGGGGFNEIRFEDAAGSEEVFLHAQKDWNIVVLNDRTQNIGHDHAHQVGHDETMEVKNDRKRTVGANETIEVAANETVTIGGDRSDSVKGNHAEEIGGNRTLAVKGDDSTEVSGKRDTSIGGNESVSVGGNQNVAVKGNQAVTISGNDDLTVSGNWSSDVNGNASHKVAGNASDDVSGDIKVKSGGKITIEGSSEILLKAGGSQIKIDGGGVTIKGSDIKLDASGNVKIAGSAIAQN